MGALSALGLSQFDEQVYDALVERTSASVAELVASVGSPSAVMRKALRRLEQLALVKSEQRGRWVICPPEPALGALVHAQQQALELVRAHGQELARRTRAREARRPEDLVDVIVGGANVVAHYEQMQRTAQHEVKLLDRPPYPVTGGGERNPLQAERVAAGVVYRTVYDRGLLDEPHILARIKVDLAAGERGRVLREVPFKLAIADRSLALLPLIHADETSDAAALMVRPSVLLDSLDALFEALWLRGVPMKAATAGPELGEVDPELGEVVVMMAAGLTDDSIARQLGTSERTVRRRIAQALSVLGADTRFQAGLRAAQLGWLPDR